MSALRKYVVPLGVIAAAIILYISAPWASFGLGSIAPSKDVYTFGSIVFWVLAIIVALTLFEDRKTPGATVVEVEGPEFSRYLFSNTRAGLLWLPIRLFVGFAFFSAGLHKLLPDGKAIGAGWLDGGASLLGYWKGAVAIPEAPGHAAITFEWYRDFLNLLINNGAQSWFGYVIVFGEIAIGLGLIFGVLTGVAAFFGVTMNMSFLLAGTASTNPILFALGIGLIMGWRVAGYYGVDRYLLPRLGVPWHARVVEHPASMGAPMTS